MDFDFNGGLIFLIIWVAASAALLIYLLKSETPVELSLSTWTRRLGASFIDGLLIVISIKFVFVPLGWTSAAGAVPVIYFGMLEASKWQASVGKRLLGIKVVNESGEKIGFAKAALRLLGVYISNFLAVTSLGLIFLSKRNQLVHDKMTNTFVVTK